MTKVSFFIRFTLVYTLVMAATGFVMELLELDSAGATNLIVLFGLFYWFLYSFGQKNGLPTLTNDKWLLIGIGVFGSFIATVLLGVPAALSMDIPFEYVLVGLLITLPLSLLVLVMSHKAAVKTVSQQMAQSAGNAS